MKIGVFPKLAISMLFMLLIVLSSVVMAGALEISCMGFEAKLRLKWRGQALVDPITEVWWFLDDAAFNLTESPYAETPVGSGTWVSQLVYSDPFGQARSLGGIKWSTSGPGIDLIPPGEASFYAPGNVCGLCSADVYIFDSSTGQYTSYLDLPCTLPEPSSMVTLATTLAALGGLVMRRRRA